jgi:hypothetical protein
MTAVFVAMIVCAGAGFGVAGAAATYAQRAWRRGESAPAASTVSALEA